MAVCDRCSTKVETGGGYAVYSTAQLIPGQDVGEMLLCENCANELFTEKIWDEAKPITVEIDSSMDFDAIKRVQRQLNDFAIAMLAKNRGLSPAQTQQEAQEIAQLWWKDRQAAEQQLQDQLSVPKVDIEPVIRDDVDASKESPLMVAASFLLIIVMVAAVVGGCLWVLSLL